MCQHFHRFFHPQQAQVAFLVPQPYHELVEVPSGMQNQLQKNANFICIQNSNKQWNSAIWKLFTITEYCKTTQAIEKVYVVSTCQKFCFQFWEIIQNYFEHKVATILMASWKKKSDIGLLCMRMKIQKQKNLLQSKLLKNLLHWSNFLLCTLW